MNRSPALSSAMPPGDKSVLSLSPLVDSKFVLVNDPFWPNTSSAVVSPPDPGIPGKVPPWAGVKYSSTRWLPDSETKRSRADSKVSPDSNPTKQRLSAVGAAAARLHLLLVKLPSCPSTMLAVILLPPAMGLAYSTMRLLPASTTHRLLPGSIAT